MSVSCIKVLILIHNYRSSSWDERTEWLEIRHVQVGNSHTKQLKPQQRVLISTISKLYLYPRNAAG
jgi:hypothetical protein